MFATGFGEMTLLLMIVVIVLSGRSLKPLPLRLRESRARPEGPAWRASDWVLLAAAILLASFALAGLAVRSSRKLG